MSKREPYDHRDAPSDTDTYILMRDGEDKFKGTLLECWRWIHNRHCYSVQHAIEHEGWSIDKETI